VIKSALYKPAPLDSTGKKKLTRNTFLFETILQQNDVISIAIDSSPVGTGEDTPKYDEMRELIGLVDTVTKDFDSSSNSVNISIQGRDLAKLFIEDGSYMYPQLWNQNYSKPTSEDPLASRFFGKGLYSVYAKMTIEKPRRVDEAVLFIINVLANIQIVPDKLFDSLYNEPSESTISKNEEYIENGEDTSRKLTSVRPLGIWGFVKVGFDENIKKRFLYDTSLGNPDGSMLELIRKWAQAPWIEIVMDTYGKYYSVMFRVPPLDKLRVNEFIKTTWFDKLYVNDTDVFSESLSWNDVAYSTYTLNYRQLTSGNNDSLPIIPTISFYEYAKVFGNKKLEYNSNLLSVDDTADIKQSINFTYIMDQGFSDLAYMMETNLYLPFTRRGSITIKGDRRFKKGMWFYYSPTNEIFYIDAIAHTFNVGGSIELTTTLQVSRGMVMDYVTGDKKIVTKDYGEQELSYFNIANTSKLTENLKAKISKNTDNKNKEPQTNEDNRTFFIPEVFNFFLSRSQMPGASPNFG
jgi:hypothetical protein